MKKSLLSLCLMVLAMASWAQNWNAPTQNDFPHSTPVYVQVKVNGEEILNYKFCNHNFISYIN